MDKDDQKIIIKILEVVNIFLLFIIFFLNYLSGGVFLFLLWTLIKSLFTGG